MDAGDLKVPVTLLPWFISRVPLHHTGSDQSSEPNEHRENEGY